MEFSTKNHIDSKKSPIYQFFLKIITRICSHSNNCWKPHFQITSINSHNDILKLVYVGLLHDLYIWCATKQSHGVTFSYHQIEHCLCPPKRPTHFSFLIFLYKLKICFNFFLHMFISMIFCVSFFFSVFKS